MNLDAQQQTVPTRSSDAKLTVPCRMVPPFSGTAATVTVVRFNRENDNSLCV